MFVTCKRKRSGLDNISLFVGIDFWSVARFTVGIDDGVGDDEKAVVAGGVRFCMW